MNFNVKKVKKNADNGDTQAKLELAKWLLSFECKNRDPKTAIEYLKSAADDGNAEALFLLAELYMSGKEVALNRSEALFYFEKSRDIGYEQAALRISKMNYRELEDIKNSFRYQLLKAEEGDRESQYRIAQAYVTGSGVERNAEKAIEFFEKSKEQGKAEALFELGKIYSVRENEVYDIEKAVMYFKEAAGKGMEIAVQELAEIYTVYDPLKAVPYYEMLAERGSISAQNVMGQIYEGGKFRPQDFAEAKKWYKRAADKGDVESCIMLADLLSEKENDMENAMRYYLMASNQGNGEAALKLRELVTNLLIDLIDKKEYDSSAKKFRTFLRDGVPMDAETSAMITYRAFDAYFENEENLFNAENSSFVSDWAFIAEGYPLDFAYDIAVKFEEEKKLKPAVGAYLIASITGNRKATSALINMSAKSSRYFMNIIDITDEN